MTSWANIGIIAGIVGALITAGVAMYRARPQRDLDTRTARKIEMEIARETAELDRRRTIRVLRLEKYVDQDIAYHRRNTEYQRKLAELLTQCIDNGHLEGQILPTPPDPPELPQVPLDDDDA